MATSVIQIPVDSEQFDQFIKRYQDYQDKLKDMPKEWQDFNKVIGAATLSLSGASAEFSKNVKKSTKEVSLMGTAYKKVEDSVKNTNKALQATGSLINRLVPSFGMASLTLGGLLSLPAIAFGLFSSLQRSFGSERTAATRAGVSIGQNKAFNLDFGRYGFGTSTLSRISSIKNNIGQWGPIFQATGGQVGMQDMMAQGNEADLFFRMASILRNEKNPIMAQYRANAMGFSNEDFNAIRMMSNKEFETQRTQYYKDVNTLGVNDEDARAAQDFTNSLERMTDTLKTTLFKDLVPLEPQLQQLSATIGKILNDFLTSDWFKQGIKDFGTSLEQFTKYLTSGQARADFDEFLTDLKALGQAAYKAADFLGLVPHKNEQPKLPDDPTKGTVPSATKPGYVTPLPPQASSSRTNALGNSFAATGSGAPYGFSEHGVPVIPQPSMKGYGLNPNGYMADHPVYADYLNRAFPGRQADVKAPEIVQQTKDLNAQLKALNAKGPSSEVRILEQAADDKALGLATGTLNRQYQIESQSGKNMVGPTTRSGEHALGNLQWMSGTAKQYNVTPGDWESERRGRMQLVSYLLKHYNGDQRMAFAAYNWGQGNVDSLVKKYGKNWLSNAPRETQNYVARIIVDNRAGNDINTIMGNSALTSY